MGRTDQLSDEVAAVMDQLQVRGVFLGGVNLDINRDVIPGPDASDINVSAHHEVDVEQADGYVKAVARFTVEGKRPKARKAFIRVKGSYDILFNKIAGELTPQSAAEVGKTATMVVWPYIREIVTTLASRSAVAIPLPPLLKLSDLHPSEE